MDKQPRDELLARMAAAREAGSSVEEARGGYKTAGQPAVATNPYYSIYRTRDGSMVIACLNNRLRRAAATLLGVDDPRVHADTFDPTALDLGAAAVLKEHIEAAFASRSTDDWCAIFDAANIPCGPVRLSEELFDDPHVAAQNLILDLEHPIFGAVKMPNLPIRMSDADVGATISSPALGQHTAEFLHELGYESAEIERLRESGVVKVWDA
jgi:crotonobetainyl-CoA:carnitine CoA-transferase CaiB-like acyl-CoA transferase